MDRSRKASLEGNEATSITGVAEVLPDEKSIAEKLTQLVAFIAELEQDPAGSAQLQRRFKLYGECRRPVDKPSLEFSATLLPWVERDIPQTKLPLHRTRQTDVGEISQESNPPYESL